LQSFKGNVNGADEGILRVEVDVRESGEWRVESGEWRVVSGEWRVESGEWRVESGEWRVGAT